MASSNYPSKKLQWTTTTILFVLGISLMAMTLRSPLTVVGPIISDIKDGLHISNVLAGFITTIPLLAFAIVSPFTARIARKLGMERTLFMALLLLAFGIILRSNIGIFGLLTGTFLIGVAIAFGNVLIPSYLKLRYPLQIGLMMGIYTVSMNITAGVAAGISYPIATTALGWRGALAFSVIIVVIAILLWLPQLKNNAKLEGPSHTTKPLQLWKSPLVWAITCMMGLQSLIFYTTAAWIPEMFISQGLSASEAGWMFSILQLSQLPMTFLTPILASKMSSQRSLVIAFSLCYFIGFIGVYLQWTSLAIVWMVLLGLAGGASFSLVMILFTLRTETVYASAELSGFAQSLGYLLAAIGPTLFGWLYDATGTWSAPAIGFLTVALLLFISGLYASQNKTVEQTLQ